MNPEELYVSLGQRIRKAREACGLTQAQLAAAVSLTRTSITNIEQGKQKLLLHTVYDLAAALNVPPTLLLPEPMEQVETRELELQLPRGLSLDEQEWIRSVVDVRMKGK